MGLDAGCHGPMGHNLPVWRPRYSKVGKFTLPLCVNAGTPALGIYSDLEARMRNVLGLVAASAQKAKMIALASAVLSGLAFTPVIAAEREQVRAVINLIAAAKMPFPERFERNVARTEYVRLDGGGETVACLRIDDKVRWCYEHIPPLGARTELPAHALVATVIQFFVRGTGRGDQFRTEYQKLYDDGIQVALKYLGE